MNALGFRTPAHVTKTTQVNKTTALREANTTDWFFWSIEKMDIEMGPAKAQHWRDSGKLKVFADSLTGSTDEMYWFPQ